jgi:phosphate starvation-inducible PhoH-like protein
MKKPKKSENNLYKPKTFNQEKYVEFLNNDDTKIVVAVGPAGTGKTLFACQKAITSLKSEQIHKIIITRPVVTVEEEIGFLPGNLIKKMDPWTKPIFDIFLEYYTKNELDLMLSNGKIEICPLAFMRGRTFKHAFIIADEMQNSSPNQMKMLTTRIGNNCKMIITGDLKQTDILKENGLHDFIKKIRDYNDMSTLIELAHFDKIDIERSEIVKKVIEIYENSHDFRNAKITHEEPSKKEVVNDESNVFFESNTKEYIPPDTDAAIIPKTYITKNYSNFLDSMKNF